MSRCIFHSFDTILLSTLFLLAAVAQAPPSADTFISSVTPKINYGVSPILVVQPDATTFIKLDLSTLPANASVSKATLRLHVDLFMKEG